MRDDGQEGDRIAGDGIWTYAVFMEGNTYINYKYTIGLPQDEERWSGTEEFPLRTRGITTPNEGHSLIVYDVFADRPEHDGDLGNFTEVTQE